MLLLLPNDGVELPKEGVGAAGVLVEPNDGAGFVALLPKAKDLFSVVVDPPPKLKDGAGEELGAPPKLNDPAAGCCCGVAEKLNPLVAGLAGPPKLKPVEAVDWVWPKAAGDAELWPKEKGAGAGVLEAPKVGGGAAAAPKLGAAVAPKAGAGVLLELKELGVEPKLNPVEGGSEINNNS